MNVSPDPQGLGLGLGWSPPTKWVSAKSPNQGCGWVPFPFPRAPQKNLCLVHFFPDPIPRTFTGAPASAPHSAPADVHWKEGGGPPCTERIRPQCKDLIVFFIIWIYHGMRLGFFCVHRAPFFCFCLTVPQCFVFLFWAKPGWTATLGSNAIMLTRKACQPVPVTCTSDRSALQLLTPPPRCSPYIPPSNQALLFLEFFSFKFTAF